MRALGVCRTFFLLHSIHAALVRHIYLICELRGPAWVATVSAHQQEEFTKNIQQNMTNEYKSLAYRYRSVKGSATDIRSAWHFSTRWTTACKYSLGEQNLRGNFNSQHRKCKLLETAGNKKIQGNYLSGLPKCPSGK